MADPFIKTFAKHMHDASHLNVHLAENNVNIEPATIYICSKLCRIVRNANHYSFSVSESINDDYNPNISELFKSCAMFSNKVDVLALILTGIGDDGASGIVELCKTKANCVSESKESAVVYGMPQRALEVSSRVQSQSLDEIIQTIKEFGA